MTDKAREKRKSAREKLQRELVNLIGEKLKREDEEEIEIVEQNLQQQQSQQQPPDLKEQHSEQQQPLLTKDLEQQGQCQCQCQCQGDKESEVLFIRAYSTMTKQEDDSVIDLTSCSPFSEALPTITSTLSLPMDVTPANSSVSSNMLHFGVIVRGEISHRIFTAWQQSLPKALSRTHKVILSNHSHEGVEKFDYLVADTTVNQEVLDNWMCGHGLSSSCVMVYPSYLIHLIKARRYDPPSESQAHRLSRLSVPVDLSVDDACESLLPSSTSSVCHSNTAKPAATTVRPQYACIISGTAKAASQANPNKRITDILEELQHIYELIHDEWRSQGYKKCVALIKQMPRITDITQLNGVRGIGASMKAKIQEILVSGKLQKLAFFKSDPKLRALYELTEIWGVGEKTASQLMRQGFRSVSDLREHGLHLLTAQQRIGLQYYEEFQQKIPRVEVEAIGQVVREQCQQMLGSVEVIICGSYRRGKPQSGDADILIVPSIGQCDRLPSYSLQTVLDALSARGFLTDHLALPEDPIHRDYKRKRGSDFVEESGDSSQDVEGPVRSSYMGVCQLNSGSAHRRIDIKIYPRSMLPFAILYFTGSDHFNRSMRLFAKRRGFQLTDRHLLYREKIRRFPYPYTIGQHFNCASEEEIFEVLGLPYKAPTDRNVFDVAHLQEEEENVDQSDGGEDEALPPLPGRKFMFVGGVVSDDMNE
eukprot:gene10650-11809_t